MGFDVEQRLILARRSLLLGNGAILRAAMAMAVAVPYYGSGRAYGTGWRHLGRWHCGPSPAYGMRLPSVGGATAALRHLSHGRYITFTDQILAGCYTDCNLQLSGRPHTSDAGASIAYINNMMCGIDTDFSSKSSSSVVLLELLVNFREISQHR